MAEHDAELWCSDVPLIYFHTVEMHLPMRVCWKFWEEATMASSGVFHEPDVAQARAFNSSFHSIHYWLSINMCGHFNLFAMQYSGSTVGKGTLKRIGASHTIRLSSCGMKGSMGNQGMDYHMMSSNTTLTSTRPGYIG